jgi:hypothetical protein
MKEMPHSEMAATASTSATLSGERRMSLGRAFERTVAMGAPAVNGETPPHTSALM